MARITIGYYGKDESLIPILNKEKNQFIDPSSTLHFEDLNKGGLNSYERVQMAIIEGSVNVLMIDLNDFPEFQKALLPLYFEATRKQIKLIGLWSNRHLFAPEKIFNDVAFSTHLLYKPEDRSSITDLIITLSRIFSINNENTDFYTVNVKMEVPLYYPGRIYYMDSKGLKVESDLNLKKDETVKIIFPELKGIPFKYFIVEDTSNLRMSTNFHYKSVLNYCFQNKRSHIYNLKEDDIPELDYIQMKIDEKHLDGDVTENEIREIKNELRDNRNISKEKINQLRLIIDKNKQLSLDEDPRILIIEDKPKPYPDKMWNSPYNFFLSSLLESYQQILRNVHPDLIVFSYPNYKSHADLEISTEFKNLKRLCQCIKSLRRESPKLAIFNMRMNEADAKQIFEYDNIQIMSGTYDFNKVLEVIRNCRQKKETFRYDIIKKDLLMPSFYSSIGKVYFQEKVELLEISEGEIIIESPHKMELYRPFKIDLEPDFTLHLSVINIKESDDGSFIIRGIIHSIDESTKKQLRTFISKKGN